MTSNGTERRVSERREGDAGRDAVKTVMAGVIGFLFAVLMNYLTVMSSLNKMDSRLVRIETVVCASNPCPKLGD